MCGGPTRTTLWRVGLKALGVRRISANVATRGITVLRVIDQSELMNHRN